MGDAVLSVHSVSPRRRDSVGGPVRPGRRLCSFETHCVRRHYAGPGRVDGRGDRPVDRRSPHDRCPGDDIGRGGLLCLHRRRSACSPGRGDWRQLRHGSGARHHLRGQEPGRRGTQPESALRQHPLCAHGGDGGARRAIGRARRRARALLQGIPVCIIRPGNRPGSGNQRTRVEPAAVPHHRSGHRVFHSLNGGCYSCSHYCWFQP